MERPDKEALRRAVHRVEVEPDNMVPDELEVRLMEVGRGEDHGVSRQVDREVVACNLQDLGSICSERLDSMKI